jgi:hypothetical protein
MMYPMELHPAAPASLSPEALTRLSSAELEAMFANAAPFPLDALDGDPRGRALAVPGFDRGLPGAIVRAVHGSALLPWEGKTFAVRPGASEGIGINRVRIITRHARFPFKVYATQSVVDGRPCNAIDYDVPQNASIARPVYDELRAVEDGLFLGRGMRRVQGRSPRLLVWFALDARTPDRPVAWDGYRAR